MSVKTKNNLKRLPKLLGVALFTLLFFFNIQIMLSDKQSGEADISLFGVKVNLFESANAQSEGGGGFNGKYVTSTCMPSCIGYYPGSHNCFQCVSTPFNPYCNVSAAYCSQY